MRERVRHQPTNCPEVDAGNPPARKIKNRRRAITRKTTAGKTEADLEHHKGMSNCLFLDYCRRLSEVSVKNGRPGTHGRFFVGSAVQRPAGIEQRTANSLDVVSIQAKQGLPEEIICRRAVTFRMRQPGQIFSTLRKLILKKSTSESARAGVEKNFSRRFFLADRPRG
jgi:hypothetical protein